MKSRLTVSEHEELKREFLREQKYALVTARRKGDTHDLASWLNKLGLSDYVIGMSYDQRSEHTSITFKVPVDRAEVIQEYIRFTDTPCWGDVPAPEHREMAFDRS